MKIKWNWAKQHILLLSISVLFLQSCNEESGPLGTDIIPSDDQALVIVDTIKNIGAYTIKEDAIRCDEDINSTARDYNLVGSYVDAEFGTTTAGFFTQVRLSKNSVNLGDDLNIDSLVLYLDVKGHYGDSLQAYKQTLSVYQLTDSISKDEEYESDIDVAGYYNESEPLWQKTYAPAGDSVLALKLDADPFFDILNDTNNLIDNDIFTALVKGLYIKTEAVDFGGSIRYFDLLSEQSKLTLYYQSGEETGGVVPASKQKTFDFLINDNCARINLFTHDYSTATSNIESVMNDTATIHDLLYVQGLGGVKVKLDLANLLTWRDSMNYIITRAELVVPVLEDSFSEYAPPSILSLLFDTDESNVYLPDQYHNGVLYSDYFGGIYSASEHTYTFNIAQYMQQIIVGETTNTDLELGIYPREKPVLTNRTILKSPSLDGGLSIKITYMKL